MTYFTHDSRLATHVAPYILAVKMKTELQECRVGAIKFTPANLSCKAAIIQTAVITVMTTAQMEKKVSD